MDLISTTFTPTPFDGLGKEARVAYHPQAPVDEVQDAGQMLMKAYQGYGLPNQMDIYSIVQQTIRLKRAEAAGNRMLTKAIAMMHPEAESQKARTEPWTAKVGGGGKYLPKPGIPMAILRQIRKRLEVAGALHNTWIRQVKGFAKLSTKPDEEGFQLYHLDPNAELDERQNDFLRWLSQFLVNGGRDFDPVIRKQKRRQTLPYYFGALTEHALTFDLAATEKVGLVVGRGIDSFYLRDSATFALANFGPTLEEDEVYAYQIAFGTEEIPFYSHELALFQRNLDYDLNACGYGVSELEASVDTLSKIITAMQYTQEGLDNNAIPRGILSVFGQFDRNTKELFKSAWDAKLRGVMNSFKLPVLFGQQGQIGDVKFTPTGEPFNEMAFAQWIGLNTAIFCANYGNDPKEVGLEGWSAKGSTPLSGDDTEQKLLWSRNTNFKPFMTALADHVRDELIAPFATWVGVRFNGIIAEDAQKRQEEKRRMMTINEIRKEMGMDPHPLGWFGNLPADKGLMDAEFQRLNATLTYDEARETWGGLKVFPSELVGMTPLNPSLGAMWNMAATAAGQDTGGEDGGGADPENPFNALDPGQDDGRDATPEGEEGQETQGDSVDAGMDKKPGLFDQPEEEDGQDGGLKEDVAAKLKQV